MSYINGVDSSSSNFFSSYALQSSNSGGSLTSSLGDYALIKSGSYKKLLNSYYKKTDSSKNADTEEVKKEKKNLVTAKSDADALNSSVKTLMETTFTEDNRDAIKENVQGFIEAYNSLVDSGSDVEDKSVLRNTLWMTQASTSMSKLLTDAGITIGKGNKLSLDETKFGNAEMTVLKTLFTGSNSYADKLMQKSAAISKAAATSAADGKSASAYTNKGRDYDQISTKVLYDSLT